MREPARLIDVVLAPAWGMMDQHDAGKGARSRWSRDVSGYRCSLVAFDEDVLANHASIERHRFLSIGWGRDRVILARAGREAHAQPARMRHAIFARRGCVRYSFAFVAYRGSIGGDDKWLISPTLRRRTTPLTSAARKRSTSCSR